MTKVSSDVTPQTEASAATARAVVPELTVTNRQLLGWMLGFLRPVRWALALACFYVVAVVLTEVMGTQFMGLTVNRIQQLQHDPQYQGAGFFAWLAGANPDASAIRGLLLWLVLFTVVNLLMRYLREVANMRFSMHMVFYIREAVYDKLQRVGFSFHDALSSGQLINRALTDLQNVRQFLVSAMTALIEIVLVVGFYMLIVGQRSQWMAGLALMPVPIWTFYILRFSRRVQPKIKDAMAADDRNVSLITENIAGVHVVKAFATEETEIERYEKHCDDYYSRVRARIRMFANFLPKIRAIAILSNLALFCAGGILIIKKQMMAGDLLVIGQAMNAILGRLQLVPQINDQYQSAIVSSRRLYEILAADPTVRELAQPKLLPEGGGGAVKFEKVTFGYNPDRPVLKNVSFEAPGGSVVAIVGPTGAGKSTMMQLLGRFYDPQTGTVSIDGVDVRDLSLDDLRRQVAFVFQETYLFSDTVAANIAYGRPGMLQRGVGSDVAGEVEAASRLAQAHDFVASLPRGYQTMLGERGSSLSGGQRQRLAIARAVLSNPRILVLDDATAAIDSETEDLIRKGMRFVMHGRTTFVIAHRISTVKRADLVIVLEGGRITQTGTHAQLATADGHYRKIVEAQLYGDEAPSEGRPSHMDRVRDPRQLAVAAPVRENDEEMEGV